ENARARFRRRQLLGSPMSWRRPQRCCFSVAPLRATKKSSKCWLVISCWLRQQRFGNVSRFLLRSAFSILFCAEIFCSSHLIAIAPTRKDCGCDGGTFCFTPAL